MRKEVLPSNRRIGTGRSRLVTRLLLALFLLCVLPGTAMAQSLITLSPATVPDGTQGVPYNQTITASGGVGPYTFTQAAGNIPPGLSISTTGVLSGTPTGPGTYSFTIAATDTVTGAAGSQPYTMQILVPPVITITPATIPNGTVGVAYSQAITASGGMAPYSFAVTAGALPPGLAMDAAGNITGSPTAAGSYGFTVTATDGILQQGSQPYTLAVAAPTITLAPPTLPNATTGVAYNQAITASGGTGPYNFAVTAGTLPTGLSLDTVGNLTGTPTAAGTANFTVTATDSFGSTGTQAYALVIAAPTITLAPPTLANGTVGVGYSQTMTASGGVGPYSFAVTAGTLPTGLSLDAAGNLSGTPTTAGTTNFTVTATDAFGSTGSQPYTLVVAAPTITLAPPTLPNATTGVAYNQAITASGGTGPYNFAVTAGTLPTGLSLDTVGNLTGTPTAAGTANFTVTATDSFGSTGTQAYALVIATPTITLVPPTLANGTVGVGYSQTMTASGGVGPYSFAVTAGTLPTGLSLDAAGNLSGTPTATGTSNFTVTATDAFASSGSRTYTLVVVAPTITLTPATLPGGAAGAAYSQTISASGGTAPYSFAITAGALPTGLTLDSSGALSGTPTLGGSYGFTVTATGALGQAGNRTYTLGVSPRPDPTLDPDVRGLLQSQAASARTFANVQIVNFTERLENLHHTERSGGTSSPWGFWFAGTWRNGDRDASGNVSSLSFETSGLSAGVDYSFSDALAFGFGLGYGRDRTAIGQLGSHSDATAPGLVSYGSWHPLESPFFIDGMLGYQKLDFDLKRFVPASGSMVSAPRDGQQKFTSWSAGYEYENDEETFMWSAYGRADVADGELEAFTERGDPIHSLHYGEQDIEMRTTTLGLRMKFKKEIDWGSYEPRFRIEFQHDFHENNSVALRYADLPAGPVYHTNPAGLDRSRLVVEIGNLLRTTHGFIFRLDYRGIFGGYNDREHWLRFSMEDYDD